MIAYRDYIPQNAGFFPKADAHQKMFDSAVARANQWVEAESIEVINVETVVGSSPTAPILMRVWYHSTVEKPPSFPEV